MAKKKKNEKNKLTTSTSRLILANAPIQPALKFRIEEAYKAIRTNIMFSIMKQGCKIVVVTSSNPSEGKTTSTVNLAVSIAQADQRVLLIDGDLRKPKVHQYFEVPNAPGLTNYLSDSISGKRTDLFSVIHPTAYENLSVLCSGSIPPNPAELLGSELMSNFLKSVGKDFDYIIIDTPPINVVSDALPLIRESDGTVMVVRQNHTTHPDIQRALSSLEFIDAKIIGFIVNFVDSNSSGSYGKYGYKYKRDYGYGYGYGGYGYGYGYGYGSNKNSNLNINSGYGFNNKPQNLRND